MVLGAVASSTPSVVWIVVALIVVAIAIVAVTAAQRRSTRLRERFGPEYDRKLGESGSRKVAEAELAGRQKRVQGFKLRDLTPGARDRYRDEWREVQARFVDDPGGAIATADGS